MGRKQCQIVKVVSDYDEYYIIKTKKNGFFENWQPIGTGKFVFSIDKGWNEKLLRFDTQEEAEEYVFENVLEQKPTEYVVKEYCDKPNRWLGFIRKDKTRENYINELNSKETKG